MEDLVFAYDSVLAAMDWNAVEGAGVLGLRALTEAFLI